MTDRAQDRPQWAEAPFRLDLEQQKKRAKELCRLFRAGDAAARARFRAHHPRAGTGPSADPGADLGRLGEAQLVIARELGVPSWARLKAHILSMERARAAISGRREAPDREPATLHLRCGSDIAKALSEAGFAGDFLEYSNPFCQGPVTDDPDPIASRARFVAQAYGAEGGFTTASATDKLRAEEEGLATAAARYARVVLWMEHDSYDQLVLARCLAHFAEAGAPGRLELVTIGHFPGSARFIGLGQLPPEALRLLWTRRTPVGGEQLELGRAAWKALKAPDPRALAGLAGTGMPALPHMAGALLRHLRELPSMRDGLGLTQRLVLDLLAEESLTFSQAFRRLMVEREPLPWLGDLMLWAILKDMLRAADPAFRIAPETRDAGWPHHRLEITPAGREVLAGRRDWLSCGPPERWVGGVRIDPEAPCWRWDEGAGRPVRV